MKLHRHNSVEERFQGRLAPAARGHEYTAENTYVRPDRPNRMCRRCRAESERKRVKNR